MEDAFSPEGNPEEEAAAAAAARAQGTARAFASTGSGQRRVRPALVRCSVVMVAAGTVSLLISRSAQHLTTSPHSAELARLEPGGGRRAGSVSSLGVAMCSVAERHGKGQVWG
ncbi:unnamed protein product [Miscanthus lutarioriparius]|uniref:Uncharacterized protein n=1 Tax=Miscanthus lutarioriparius TaxID=422564 RepID=A0A811QUC5_9POAL|nr:unnamed protein product [Miscanthus lutarioriparius]